MPLAFAKRPARGSARKKGTPVAVRPDNFKYRALTSEYRRQQLKLIDLNEAEQDLATQAVEVAQDRTDILKTNSVPPKE
jgi:hypothetical protein